VAVALSTLSHRFDVSTLRSVAQRFNRIESIVGRLRRDDVREVDVEVLYSGRRLNDIEAPDPEASPPDEDASTNGATQTSDPAAETMTQADVEPQRQAPLEVLTPAPTHADVEPQPQEAHVAVDDATVEAEFCEIALWRGYYKASFYARAFDSSGEEVAVAESRPFRLRRGEDAHAPSSEALEAHKELVERLAKDGWRLVRDGSPWYSMVFSHDSLER
jgi:hypothetical protein